MAKRKLLKLEPEEPGAIKIGTANLKPDEFSPDNTKVRISMWIDSDVLGAVRSCAASDRMKYQTWLNQRIREVVFGPPGDSLEKRVAALERTVFKRAQA